MKNFIVRTITGIIFVAAIVTCFLNPHAMVWLFGIVTGLTLWEFTGLVNNTGETQQTTVWTGDGGSFDVSLGPNAIRWYEIGGAV